MATAPKYRSFYFLSKVGLGSGDKAAEMQHPLVDQNCWQTYSSEAR